jgi:hypothetical protein
MPSNRPEVEEMVTGSTNGNRGKSPAERKWNVNQLLFSLSICNINLVFRFRWVVCQLDVLRKCLKLDGLRKALKSLPKTLDETYDRILMNIDEQYIGDAFKVLQFLAFSARPVKIEEVAEVLAVDFDHHGGPRFNADLRLRDAEAILTICSSLVTTSGSEISPLISKYEIRHHHDHSPSTLTYTYSYPPSIPFLGQGIFDLTTHSRCSPR